MNKPMLKRHLQIERVPPDAVILLGESQHEILNGRIFSHLLPVLDGQHTMEGLIHKLGGLVSPPEIMMALAQLGRRGLLVDGATEPGTPRDPFWHRLGSDARTAESRLAATPVRLVALGSANPAPLRDALDEATVRLTDGEDAALTIVVTDDYLQVGLDAQNQAALASGKPWLLVKLVGRKLWLGPLFVPGQSACWQCMAQRIEGNRQVESYILQKQGRQQPLPTSRPALPTTITLAAALATNEIVKWIVLGKNAALQGTLVTVDCRSMEMESHTVVRRPQCPVCGEAAHQRGNRLPDAPRLQSRRKRATGDGGHRHLLPEETYARNKHHVSPITGMISSVTRVAGLGPLMHAYSVGHNFALVRDDMTMLQRNLRSQSGGKGRTQIQAMVSGMCEAMERYSAVYRPGEYYEVRGTLADRGDKGIDLRDLLTFSPAQYENRHAWNRALKAPYHTVPNPYDPAAEISWTPIWSMTNEEWKYIPTSYCFFGHPDLMRYFFSGSDSSGCAAGNTLEEAALQGFLELTERDAISMWWHNQLRRPGVDLAAFRDPWFDQMQAEYQALGRALWVLDITNDLEIPTFVAISGRQNRAVEDILVGFGSHLDPKLAISRAITEVNQYLPNVIADKPDGTTRYWMDEPATLEWMQNVTLANQPYLAPADGPLRTPADYPTRYSDDLRDDFLYCVERARAVGLETLLLDYSPPDIEIKTCRVVVPGLRHMWRRLGAGRLYDVPVRLGWLDQPKHEDDLNPYSVFF